MRNVCSPSHMLARASTCKETHALEATLLNMDNMPVTLGGIPEARYAKRLLPGPNGPKWGTCHGASELECTMDIQTAAASPTTAPNLS